MKKFACLLVVLLCASAIYAKGINDKQTRLVVVDYATRKPLDSICVEIYVASDASQIVFTDADGIARLGSINLSKVKVDCYRVRNGNCMLYEMLPHRFKENAEVDTVEMLEVNFCIVTQRKAVFFAEGSSAVVPFYQAYLKAVARQMKFDTNREVVLSGHSDCRGTEEEQKVISEKRAEAAKQLLVQYGITPGRIKTEAHGSKYLAVPCELPNGEPDPEGAARNRRVEINFQLTEN